MCRSDAPRSIMIVNRSCIVAAMVSSLSSVCPARGRPRRPSVRALAHRHPEHFLDGGDAVEDLLERVLAEGLHALRQRQLADLRGGGIAENHLTQLVRDR